ncbi:DNA lyase [Candidatus Pacearchaeota archaeon]|nr:DNA lyase [Candidatus Pacearchaeota archaeon]
MKKELLQLYKNKKYLIKNRLESFKSLTEDQKFKEFLFCLLTPQSNAQKCWEAVEQLSNLKEFNINNIAKILKTKTRFHNTKAKRILKARETFPKIEKLLENNNKKVLRKEIAEIVNGYGLKEASHFIRNIGLSNNEIAILDRHILRNLKSLKIISEDKMKNNKHYLETEEKFLNLAKSLKIPPDELDLLFWSKENGEIFK